LALFLGLGWVDIVAMQRVSRSPRQHKTLGLFTDWLKDPYQNSLMNAVSRSCAEHDANMLCFAGGHLDPKESFWSKRTLLYEFASKAHLDALIVMGANVGTLVGPERLREYLGNIPVPNMVSLAYRLEGIPSVLVDNSVGLRQAIEHLIDVHHRKRIGFIRGPVENTEAEERYAVYRAVLAERGLPFDPRRVMVGDFLRPSGATAMQAILESGAYPDAIIAANDLMALGALDVLKAEGVKVPEEVSVIGFDDVDEARLAIPQLTTIRQPLLVMGREAVRLALARIRGESTPSELTVPTQVIYRRSCGCGANTWDTTEHLVVTIPPTAGHDEVRKRFAEGFATLALDGVFVDEATANDLFEAYFTEVETGVTEAYVRKLSELIRSTSSEQLVAWNRLNIVISRALQAWADNDSSRRHRFDEIARQVRAAVGDVSELSQGIQRVKLKRLMLDLSEVSRALTGTTSFDGIRTALNAYLPSLGIKTWYISLYENPAEPRAGAWLALAYSSKDPGVAKAVGQTFPTADLVPFGAVFGEHREGIILEPLFIEQEQIGVLALGVGPDEGVVYEALRDRVSSAVHMAHLVERLSEALKRNRPVAGA
jgi:DNA-binding LacI/PurR family transcriptional regulator